jgi:hypothetical protein
VTAYGKGTYLSGESFDTQTNFTGVSVGTTIGFDAGPARILLGPEITASPRAVVYPGDPELPQGFYLWGYLRSGVVIDTGNLVFGVSGAARTDPISEGIGLHYPFTVAGEVHWILPSTGLVLNLNVASEIDPIDGFYILGGAGISILN